MILEGAMMIVTVTVLTIFHPGVCFGGEWASANFGLRRKSQKQTTNVDESKEVSDSDYNVQISKTGHSSDVSEV